MLISITCGASLGAPSIGMPSGQYRNSSGPNQLRDLRMPGTGWSVSFSGAAPWSEDEARQHYSAWLFATGLRDALEAFGAFLDECYDVTSIMRLIRKNKEAGQLLGQDWFDHQADTGTFRQFGIDKEAQEAETMVPDLNRRFARRHPINQSRAEHLSPSRE